jgi:AcrR family transcriptional regulator
MSATLLPRHEPSSWRAQAAASQRDRLLVATAEVVVARGYSSTRVADVIAAAGVSRRSFYEHFRDLEDCFLATYDRGVEVLVAELGGALSAPSTEAGWRDLLGRLLATYLQVLSTEPVFTQFALIEVLGAGHRARERYVDAVNRFHELLRGVDDLALRQEPSRSPTADTTISVLAGGLYRLVMIEVLDGRGHDLMSKYDELLALSIAMLERPVT